MNIFILFYYFYYKFIIIFLFYKHFIYEIYLFIYICTHTHIYIGFPGSLVVKNSPANEGDTGSIPGSGSSLGEGHVNQIQYSCLGIPMDREAWWPTVLGIAKSQTWLSMQVWKYIYGGGLLPKSCPNLVTQWTVAHAQQAPLSWDFPGKNTGVGCHLLLQGIFPAQGTNLGLLNCGQILIFFFHLFLLVGG